MNKTIGILGGMGPEATSYFFDLIIRNTNAAKDQEHIPVIIYSNPMVPPRSDAIKKMAPDPSPFIVQGIKALIRAGADFIVMPCITAHYFLPQVLTEVKIPMINLLEESATWARENIPGIKKAGLISSSGTLNSGLFHTVFREIGTEILSPDSEDQKEVMDAIFGNRGIKAGVLAGSPRKTILDTAFRLIDMGAEAIIAGCTEIPLVLKQDDLPVPLIEPMKIASLSCIRAAGYPVRESKGSNPIPLKPSDNPGTDRVTDKDKIDETGKPCDRLTRLSRLARLATLNTNHSGSTDQE
ncbi:aspartate/glutamate racemase family protein [Acidobacteriota bacterium]